MGSNVNSATASYALAGSSNTVFWYPRQPSGNGPWGGYFRFTQTVVNNFQVTICAGCGQNRVGSGRMFGTLSISLNYNT